MSGDGTPRRPQRFRRLSQEEIELWLAVAETVERRADAILPRATPEPAPAPATAPPGPARSYPAVSYVARPQTKAPRNVPLERSLRRKLVRGRVQVDAAIDLHGYRQAEALGVLRHFLHSVQRQGGRLVLVVTGKGGRASDPFDMTGGATGVLRRAVPMWLSQPDLRAIVVGYEEAAQPHGGAGALYVRLRGRARD